MVCDHLGNVGSNKPPGYQKEFKALFNKKINTRASFSDRSVHHHFYRAILEYQPGLFIYYLGFSNVCWVGREVIIDICYYTFYFCFRIR